MKKEYPLAKPYLGKKEESNVLQVLRSGVLSIGPFTERFEKAFAKEVGTKYACAVSSGTAGLHLALIAAGIGKGDEVITSPFSFIASANAILYVGAKPVFVDIDPETYAIDVSKIEHAITKKTKAILPVHMFGQPANMPEIMKIAKKYDLKVIEDACESLDATYRGKKAGTFGDAGVFAFYANKQITTGEGGMIVTNDKKIDQHCRSLRNQGRSLNMQWLDHEQLGYNYRIDELSAAVGVAQLERIEFLMEKRQRVARWYAEELASAHCPVTIPTVGKNATHTWFVYVVRIEGDAARRERVMNALLKEGIHTKPYVPSIHLFSFYKDGLGHGLGDFPVSESVSATSLALPFYIGLTRADVRSIVQTLTTVLEKTI